MLDDFCGYRVDLGTSSCCRNNCLLCGLNVYHRWGLTWGEAQANAIKLGGDLVTINDAAEDNWIMSQFDGLYPGVYIGLSNTDGNGFKWSSGEALSYTNWGVWTNGWQEPYYNPSLHYGLKMFTGGDAANSGVAAGSWFVSEDNWFNYWHPGTSLVGIAEIKLGSGSPAANVPGPLPILGLAAAFGFSRKLRKRMKR